MAEWRGQAGQVLLNKAPARCNRQSDAGCWLGLSCRKWAAPPQYWQSAAIPRPPASLAYLWGALLAYGGADDEETFATSQWGCS
jgi:hypothetical protein